MSRQYTVVENVCSCARKVLFTALLTGTFNRPEVIIFTADYRVVIYDGHVPERLLPAVVWQCRTVLPTWGFSLSDDLPIQQQISRDCPCLVLSYTVHGYVTFISAASYVDRNKVDITILMSKKKLLSATRRHRAAVCPFAVSRWRVPRWTTVCTIGQNWGSVRV
jgi:hypothetical protein